MRAIAGLTYRDAATRSGGPDNARGPSSRMVITTAGASITSEFKTHISAPAAI